MKLAATYARVSTARQEEEQTVKTQLSAVHERIQKDSLNLVKEYTDEGWSGDILARPALDQLRQDAKVKLWEVLVVYDPDRIARRYSYQELVLDELREAGIEVVFVTVSAPKNSEDKILHGVRGLFSEYERAKIGERFRLGKPCFGAMVQLDGSHHDWFEGRRDKCVLMVMVDDATNQMRARFSEEETTRASYDVFEGWGRKHRLPGSLYVDRDSIYRCEGAASVADQLAGKERQTQFGRAMAVLRVELILANSPQAKGRVERMNGVLQDRLVKALRLAKINDLQSANQFLETTYLRAFNQRFARAAASPLDAHQGLPRSLDEILSWEEERVVQRDWTVACEGKWYQLDKQHEALSLASRKVVVRTLRDGRVQLVYRGQKLKWRELPERPVRAKKLRPAKPRVVPTPVTDHPWRRPLFRAGRAARRFGLGDAGCPERSGGRPESPNPNRETNKTTATNKGEILS